MQKPTLDCFSKKNTNFLSPVVYVRRLSLTEVKTDTSKHDQVSQAYLQRKAALESVEYQYIVYSVGRFLLTFA